MIIRQICVICINQIHYYKIVLLVSLTDIIISNRMKKIVKLLIALFVALVSVSCTPYWELSNTLVAYNSTFKEIKVQITQIDYSTDTIFNIPIAKDELQLFSFKSFSYHNAIAPNLKFVIYDVTDSVYIEFNNYDINDKLYLKYVQEAYSNEDFNHFGGVCKIDLALRLSITDEMLSKMTKNTHYTDSIFGLK